MYPLGKWGSAPSDTGLWQLGLWWSGGLWWGASWPMGREVPLWGEDPPGVPAWSRCKIRLWSPRGAALTNGQVQCPYPIRRWDPLPSCAIPPPPYHPRFPFAPLARAGVPPFPYLLPTAQQPSRCRPHPPLSLRTLGWSGSQTPSNRVLTHHSHAPGSPPPFPRRLPFPFNPLHLRPSAPALRCPPSLPSSCSWSGLLPGPLPLPLP